MFVDLVHGMCRAADASEVCTVDNINYGVRVIGYFRRYLLTVYLD